MSQDRHIYVLAENKMVLAYAFVRVNETNDGHVLNSRQFFVFDFCVDKAYRRHGCGTKLMERLTRVAEEKKCESIELVV
jgi:ribosomal protein S18 acetylase RimI-like enzyme